MAKQKFVKKFIKKEQSFGNEPFVENLSKTELIRILYWYNQSNFSEKQKRKWAIEYFNDKSLLKIDEKYFNHTAVHLCRMVSNGYKLDDSDKEYIDEFYTKVKTYLPKKEKNSIKKKTGPTIQERMYEQVRPVLSEIDYFVDEVLQGNENKLNELISDFGRPQIGRLITHIQSYIDDFSENKEDYGISTRKKNKIVKYLEALKEECLTLVQAKKKTRKVRTPKKKSPVELCKNVKIAEDSPLKCTKIISSKYCITYNTKYNKINLLVADDVDGLGIKGTTIQNISTNKSKLFTIKDISVLKELPTSINKLKRFLYETKKLRVSKSKSTGRLNDQVHIIKVY